MSHFAGLGSAQIFERGVYILEDLEADVTVVRTVEVQSQNAGPLFIVEFKIDTGGTEKHPVGCTRSWGVKLNQRNTALPALKSFLVSALGMDARDDKARIASEFDPQAQEIATLCCTPGKNPLAGKSLKLRAVVVQTKEVRDPQGNITKASHPFTRHDWAPKK